MNCPNCQTKNPAGAKFCFNCGAAMPAACANCGTSLPPGAKFCFNCGHPVGTPASTAPAPEAFTLPPVPAAVTESPLQKFVPRDLMAKLEAARSGDAMVGERRIVTMLFCDVKGSTAAASNLDPEEWAEIINGAFEHMIKPVYHYEGTVARLMGDGILAFFGAPMAHEDDPQRAVLAGLEIVAAIRAYREQVFTALGASTSTCASASTPAWWWSARWARTCAWSTRPWATPSTWRPAWSRQRRRAPSRSPSRPTSSSRPSSTSKRWKASKSRARQSRCAPSAWSARRGHRRAARHRRTAISAGRPRTGSSRALVGR